MATMYYEPFKLDENGEMPPPDAIENILPGYKYIFYDPNRNTKSKDDPTPKDRRQAEHKPAEGEKSGKDGKDNVEAGTSGASKVPDNLEEKQLMLIDVQMRDLENYRLAVHKMGKDILLLRDHIQELEEDNSALRRQINGYDIRARDLMTTSTDLEAIERSELIVRYMTLKQQLQVQSSQLADTRDKYQKLQIHHFKHTDKDKEYDEMKRAHLAQAHELQRVQGKIKKVTKLEQACLQQERVIENMEKVIKSKKLSVDDVSKALNEENQRLRSELQQLRASSTSEDEKLRLYEQLEKAENRVSSLERTLSEQSRNWAKEKHNLQIKLREVEHGLSATEALDLPSEYRYKPSETNRYGSPRLAPIPRR